MTSVASATTWGSPIATKHALLIHGLTSSSHTWHRVGASLAAQGYLVTAPNIIGHASRVSSDYLVPNIASDLQPYLEARTYSLIIAHSMGAVTALHLLPHLSRIQPHPTVLVLVDPPLNVSPKDVDVWKALFIDACANVKGGEKLCEENKLWTREDGVYREFATRLCSAEIVHEILTTNKPWSFLERLNDIPKKWKASILLADPEILKLCPVEELHPYPHVRPVFVPGAGHWIQSEFPDVIVEEALKRLAELDEVA